MILIREVVLGLCLVCIVVNGLLFAKGNRRWLRLLSILSLGYVAVLMATVIWGDGFDVYLIRAGILSSIGMVLLLCIHLIDSIIGSRDC